ncbi:MAG: DUF4910 domain-containing protein [Gammaproteobacteria bacterium]
MHDATTGERRIDLAEWTRRRDIHQIGDEIYALIADLYPICRSITGNGVRETLRRLATRLPLEIHEVPTGTEVFDWTIPKEWNIRDAYIKDRQGNRVVDFQASNLHVVSYSVPVHRQMSLDELRPHLLTLPEHPDWIPFRTSYYKEGWGFCLSHNQLRTLRDETYEVVIDASLESGHLTYGECYLEGELDDEVLLSTHICHPSLCNENLSGTALLTVLGGALASIERRYSYRLLFIPTTIGSIAWLALNHARLATVKHGLVMACMGDGGPFTYKRSRHGNAAIDRVVEHVLRHAGVAYEVRDFTPYGFDERQFCSPGFDLPVGGLTRTRHDEYPEYHTSADNLDLVRPRYLAESFAIYARVLDFIEHDRRYRSRSPHGEPRLGKRGLYRAVGGQADGRRAELPLLWVLNFADGKHSLLDVAERSALPFDAVCDAASALVEAGLLDEEAPP